MYARLSLLKILIACAFISTILASAIYILTSVYRQPKIFQIGFNRCGTTTLSDFFNANGIKSIHYDGGRLATSIYKNYLNNRSLISKEYESYIGFFDMENIYETEPIYIAQTLFMDLDKLYPNSKFILNTRDKENWIKSRSVLLIHNGNTYLDQCAKAYKVSKSVMLDIWRRQWDHHHQRIIDYFKNRPNDLLIFNIESDPPEKLCEFFKNNYKLDSTLYIHKNATPPNGIRS